jgi:hypothetical protein
MSNVEQMELEVAVILGSLFEFIAEKEAVTSRDLKTYLAALAEDSEIDVSVLVKHALSMFKKYELIKFEKGKYVLTDVAIENKEAILKQFSDDLEVLIDADEDGADAAAEDKNSVEVVPPRSKFN